jgi:LCP family protein required for cell wall assembly
VARVELAEEQRDVRGSYPGRRPQRDQRRDGRASGGYSVDHEDQAAAAEPARRRTSWALKAMVVVGSVLLVISGGSLILLYGLSARYENKVTREDILEGVQAATDDDHGMNFLVLGSDSRQSQDNQSLDETGTRSDTIMIVHVNKAKTGAFIVSIPRDSYVDIPPAPGSWNGGPNKINAALSFGGANLAAKTIYNLTKVPLNGAMLVNFDGIERMVNAVGGVRVCPPYDVPNFFTEDYPQYNAGWQAGKCYDMKGEESMVFVRQRHDVPGGDFGRMRSQQLVMKALAEKATTSGVVLNPGKLNTLITTAAESLTVDKNMNLRDLAFALKGISPANVKFATAPALGTITTAAGSSVALDMPAVQTLFAAVIDDRTDEWLATHPQADIPSIGRAPGADSPPASDQTSG